MRSGVADSNLTLRFWAGQFFMTRRLIRSLASPGPDSPESNQRFQSTYGCRPQRPLIADGEKTRTSIGCASLYGYTTELTRAELRVRSKLFSARTLLMRSYQVRRRASNGWSKLNILSFAPP